MRLQSIPTATYIQTCESLKRPQVLTPPSPHPQGIYGGWLDNRISATRHCFIPGVGKLKIIPYLLKELVFTLSTIIIHMITFQIVSRARVW